MDPSPTLENTGIQFLVIVRKKAKWLLNFWVCFEHDYLNALNWVKCAQLHRSVLLKNISICNSYVVV